MYTALNDTICILHYTTLCEYCTIRHYIYTALYDTISILHYTTLGGLHSLVNPSISRISRNHPTAVGFRSFVTWWGMNDFFQGNSGTFSLVGFELEDGNRGFAWLCRHFLAMDVTHWDHGVGRVLMAQTVAHCTYFMARAHFSV